MITLLAGDKIFDSNNTHIQLNPMGGINYKAYKLDTHMHKEKAN